MDLRIYQKTALEVIFRDLLNETEVLLVAATGAGKTVIFDELIRRFMTRYPKMNILFMAHRQELVYQAYYKLISLWPEGVENIGLACAGTGLVDLTRPVTMGSVQTLARRELKANFRLLVVDECHHVPSLEKGGQYHKVIGRLRAQNPDLRVLGVTATPYRLGHGYVYGNECREGRSNFFPRLNFLIGLNDLIRDGFLVPIRAKEGLSMEKALAKVSVKQGEYDIDELSRLYQEESHIEAAVNALAVHGEGRKKALVFAVSVAHAQKLAGAFNARGYRASAVYSLLSSEERLRILRDFENDSLNILINVGILTEGWDSPRVSLILMCRPTKAPALFVQMLGRGTRVCSGKKDLLVLDLADNFKTHGDPASPVVTFRKKRGAESPAYRDCPACRSLGAREDAVCRHCGRRFGDAEEALERGVAPLERPLSSPLDFPGALSLPEVMEPPAPPPPAEKHKVESYRIYRTLTSSGKAMAVLALYCQKAGCVRHWMDIEGASSVKSRFYARELWRKLSGGLIPPVTIDEAIARAAELKIPGEVTVIIDGDFRRAREIWAPYH
ncbi:MAG: DEAD/DEAH box helicase [Deltaproteobacteria bacterium]|jgi:DNA repair protein RadD|nr:DEAD/DEAH box helicase [Deltaproteobacteria bacterium]